MAQNIAREDLRTQRQAVASDVKRAYYLVLQAQSALGAVQETVRSLRELDRVVEEQLAERKALRADSLDVKTRLAQAESDAFTASNDLATRKEQLNHLLGREPNIPFRVSPVPEASLIDADLDAAQAQALRQRPELTRADLQVRFADYDLRIKKAEFIPDVDLIRALHAPGHERSAAPEHRPRRHRAHLGALGLGAEDAARPPSARRRWNRRRPRPRRCGPGSSST